MLNTTESAVVDAIAARRAKMLALLQKLVDVDSGSYCEQGVDTIIRIGNSTVRPRVYLGLADGRRSQSQILCKGPRNTVRIAARSLPVAPQD